MILERLLACHTACMSESVYEHGFLSYFMFSCLNHAWFLALVDDIL